MEKLWALFLNPLDGGEVAPPQNAIPLSAFILNVRPFDSQVLYESPFSQLQFLAIHTSPAPVPLLLAVTDAAMYGGYM